MAGPGPQDQGGEKNTYYILWMIALVVLVGGLIWYFFDTQLKMFFIALRKYELIAIYAVLAFLPYDLFARFLPWFSIPDFSQQVAEDLILVRQITSQNISLEIAEALSNEVGEFIRYPASLLMVGLAWYVYHNHILMRFTRKHNMKTLVESENPSWPQIRIVNKIDLLKEDLDSGPWAMAMTPMQFAKKYKLITVDFAEKVGSGFSKTEAPEFKVTLNRLRAERAFSAQLGQPWRSVAAMAPYRRAIFAVLAAKGCRDSKKALDLIAQLAGSAGDGKLDLRGADELWQAHYKNNLVERVCKQHGYESTVMAGMVQLAREDGVLASADFLWVKPIDRRLWYVLNNVGRQTPAAEVGGIFCHWYNELALKRPLSVPVVEAAVDALELALSEVIYVPDEKERQEIMKRHQEQQASETAAEAE